MKPKWKWKCWLLSVALAGCAQEQPPTGPPALPTAILVGGVNEVEARFPDGNVARGWEEYEAMAARIAPTLTDTQGVVPLTIEDDPNAPPSPEGVSEIRWQIGKFSVSLEPDTSYTGFCIRRHILHLRLQLADARVPASIVDLHFVVWLENNRPCIGVLNTSFVGNGWCQKLCWTATKQDVQKMMSNAMLTAGLSGATAAILSRVIAPIAVVTLAL